MNKNDPIEINQVGNGFIVRRPFNLSRGDCVAYEDMLVFRTMAEMQAFLAEHFNWRAVVDRNDKASKLPEVPQALPTKKAA